MDFDDRFALAQAYLVKRYEDRDKFLSDSDVLDAVDFYTTEHGNDRTLLAEALFAWVTSEPQELAA